MNTNGKHSAGPTIANGIRYPIKITATILPYRKISILFYFFKKIKNIKNHAQNPNERKR